MFVHFQPALVPLGDDDDAVELPPEEIEVGRNIASLRIQLDK